MRPESGDVLLLSVGLREIIGKDLELIISNLTGASLDRKSVV